MTRVVNTSKGNFLPAETFRQCEFFPFEVDMELSAKRQVRRRLIDYSIFFNFILFTLVNGFPIKVGVSWDRNLRTCSEINKNWISGKTVNARSASDKIRLRHRECMEQHMSSHIVRFLLEMTAEVSSHALSLLKYLF